MNAEILTLDTSAKLAKLEKNNQLIEDRIKCLNKMLSDTTLKQQVFELILEEIEFLKLLLNG